MIIKVLSGEISGYIKDLIFGIFRNYFGEKVNPVWEFKRKGRKCPWSLL